MYTSKIVGILCFVIASTNVSADDSKFCDQQICRAAIATVMYKDVGIVTASGDGVIAVTYRSDSLKTFKCRIDGQRLMWGNADGRCRDHAMDEKVMWEMRGDILVIRQPWSDGSVSEDEFGADRL
jgi:hypothetical protein